MHKISIFIVAIFMTAAPIFAADRSERVGDGDTDKIAKMVRVLPETYKDIGQLLQEGRLDEAQAVLKRRIASDPRDYAAMTALGSIYQERGNRPAAKRLLVDAVKISPDYPIARLFLGRLYFVMRDYDKAVSELNEFRKRIPLPQKIDDQTRMIYINGLYYMSEVYLILKMYKDTRSVIEHILKLDPNQQDAYYNLGVYYYNGEHNRPEAYRSFKKAIDCAPNTGTAKSAKYAIEFMRNNPDSRVSPDFSFIDSEYRD